jgi:branched-chain amino acid transport system permease protein
VSDYAVSLVIRIGIETFVALSAYVLLVMGRISFGQQGFFALGAYAAGMVTALGGVPLVPGILLGGFVAALAGAAFGLVVGRRRGLAFAAGTLAFGELVRVGLLAFRFQVPVGADVVGPAGAEGFRGIRLLFTSGISPGAYALGIWIALAALLAALSALRRSRTGEALVMVGEDARLAAAAGIRVARLELVALGVAGGLAGIGGGLLAHYATYVEPGHADVMLGVHSLAYSLIGGLGTPLGPALGVALDIGVLESFRVLSGYRMIIFGGLVMVFLAVRPRGLLDEVTVHRLARGLRRRPT